MLGCEQQENEIDGLVVVQFVIDRLFEPGEQAEIPLRPASFTCGTAMPRPRPGRAQPLTLQERVEDIAGLEPGALRRDVRELLQRMLLARRLQRGDDAVGSQ